MSLHGDRTQSKPETFFHRNNDLPIPRLAPVIQTTWAKIKINHKSEKKNENFQIPSVNPVPFLLWLRVSHASSKSELNLLQEAENNQFYWIYYHHKRKWGGVDIELETVKELIPSANANLRRRPRSRRSPREEKSRVSILSNGEEESEEEFLEIL